MGFRFSAYRLGTWPDSHKVVERDFAGVPDDVTRKIVFENAVALYHIDI